MTSLPDGIVRQMCDEAIAWSTRRRRPAAMEGLPRRRPPDSLLSSPRRVVGTVLLVALAGGCGRSDHSLAPAAVPLPVPRTAPTATSPVRDAGLDSTKTATLVFVEITGSSAQFEAAALPTIPGIYLTEHSDRSLGGDRWRVGVYVSSTEALGRIRAAGLSVTILQTADQIRQETESIVRSIHHGDGSTGRAR